MSGKFKWYKYILLDILLYSIIYKIGLVILGKCNLTYSSYIQNFSLLIIPLGFLIGFIQITVKKRETFLGKCLNVIFVVVECAIIGFITLVYITFFYDFEEITVVEGRKMIKETHNVLFSNWVKYYDYKNPFIRDTQERIREFYDDNMNEYCGTKYYDENGNEVANIDNDKLVDLKILYKFLDNNVDYTKVEELIKEIQTNYQKYVSNIKISDEELKIYFTSNPDKILDNVKNKSIEDIANSFTSVKENTSTYTITIGYKEAGKQYIEITRKFENNYYK